MIPSLVHSSKKGATIVTGFENKSNVDVCEITHDGIPEAKKIIESTIQIPELKICVLLS